MNIVLSLAIINIYFAPVIFGSKPNILIILADDLGWDDVGFHGSPDIPTPNLDALAYDGIILNNYYVQPICTPTRSCLMSGRYPIHTGLQHGVIFSSEPYGLPLNNTILPEYLNTLGYDSHIVGKWHLGHFAKEYTPTKRGFKSHYGYYMGMEDYFEHTHSAGGPTSDGDWGFDFRDNERVAKEVWGNYSTDIFTNRAIDIIENHDKEKPLFLYFAHQAVHSANSLKTIQPPPRFMDKFEHIKDPQRRKFAGAAAAMDESVGRVIESLKKQNMLENTFIVFSTDNGGPANGFDLNMASNEPLRGVKATLWEGGVRGTGFVWSKLLKKTGYVNNDLMHISDILPTVLRIAGYDMNQLPKDLDGYDQLDILNGDEQEGRTEILLNIDPIIGTSSLRMRDMKIISGEYGGGQWDGWYPTPKSTEQTFRDDDYFEVSEKIDVTSKILNELGGELKYKTPVRVNCGKPPEKNNCHPGKAPCLFDIRKDPCEYNNLASSLPEIVNKLQMRLNEYKRKMIWPINNGIDPRGLPANNGGVWGPWINLTEI